MYFNEQLFGLDYQFCIIRARWMFAVSWNQYRETQLRCGVFILTIIMNINMRRSAAAGAQLFGAFWLPWKLSTLWWRPLMSVSFAWPMCSVNLKNTELWNEPCIKIIITISFVSILCYWYHCYNRVFIFYHNGKKNKDDNCYE